MKENNTTNRKGVTIKFYAHGIKIKEKFYWKNNTKKTEDVEEWTHKSPTHFVKYN